MDLLKWLLMQPVRLLLGLGDDLAFLLRPLLINSTGPRHAGRIAFTATSDADVGMLYWFVDTAFVGRTRPSETLAWQPSHAGSYQVQGGGDHGHRDARRLRVGLACRGQGRVGIKRAIRCSVMRCGAATDAKISAFCEFS